MSSLIAVLVAELIKMAPHIIRAFRANDLDKAKRLAREAADRRMGVAFAKWKLEERKRKAKKK